MTTKHRRQLRNYLLDRKVQLRITAVMVLLSSALTAGLGYFWYAEARRSSAVIRVNALSTVGMEAADQLSAELAAQDHTRLAVLVGFALLFALLIACYGIVMTHKFAGPLFKVSRHMNDIENGRLYRLWGLRRGDQLQEFFEQFQRMHAALRTRVEEDMRLLSSTIAAIEGGDDATAQIPALREQLAAKGDSLRDASNVTQRLKRVDAD